jgi:diguanylate cyclase (GGDEF)-like protein
LALLFIDLDKFKSINDTYGHDTGDTVLIEVAKRIKAALRESDISCRMGGDEFIVLLKDIKEIEDAVIVVEKLIQEIAAPIQIAEGDEVEVGVSMGISFFPTDDQDFEKLIIKADAAMYEAKQMPESSYQLYSNLDKED